MKVLWLSNETPDRGGQGGQRRQYFQIRSLARDGHEVIVATLAGPQSDSSVRAHADVLRVDQWMRGRIPDPRAAMKLKRSLGRDVDRVVVAHAESWRFWKRFARPNGPPVLMDLHNVLSAWHETEGRRGESRTWRRVESAILGQVDAVSVCTEPERERLNPPNSCKVLVLPHGIDPLEWQLDPTPAPTAVIKLFGNWGWDPNAEGLRWFFDEVLSRMPFAIRCEVAGSNVQIPVPPDVVHVGRVSSIPRFLSDAHVVAVPVLHGVGAPVKYLEALASGVPVIATRDGVSNARPGLATVSDDPQEWVSFFRHVIENPVQSRERAAAVRSTVMNELDWDSTSMPLRHWVSAGRRDDLG